MNTTSSPSTFRSAWPGVIQAYREFLPVTDTTPVVTLKEGNTPLIEARWLSSHTGLRVFLKFEGLNPTGSFKDRGMTLAISKAVEKKAAAVICASTGNTAASAAAYAAASGCLTCAVVIPEGRIARGKLAQAVVHNAKVIALDGNFDDALTVVRAITETHPVELVNSINPYRIEGQKTAAFEICDALTEAPLFHCIPVGNAGNITAYWKGYKEYAEAGRIRRRPRMLGFQAAGAAPIVHGRVIPNPETIATAIRIGNPASWKQAEAARDESNGLIDMVTDEEILEAYHCLAAKEGVFAEPASAASVAGLLKLHRQGYFKPHQGETLVCTLTGHGLKDPDTAVQGLPQPQRCPPDPDAVWRLIRS